MLQPEQPGAPGVAGKHAAPTARLHVFPRQARVARPRLKRDRRTGMLLLFFLSFGYEYFIGLGI